MNPDPRFYVARRLVQIGLSEPPDTTEPPVDDPLMTDTWHWTEAGLWRILRFRMVGHGTVAWGARLWPDVIPCDRCRAMVDLSDYHDGDPDDLEVRTCARCCLVCRPYEFELKTVQDIMSPLVAELAGIPWRGCVLLGRSRTDPDHARYVWLEDKDGLAPAMARLDALLEEEAAA